MLYLELLTGILYDFTLERGVELLFLSTIVIIVFGYSHDFVYLLYLVMYEDLCTLYRCRFD